MKALVGLIFEVLGFAALAATMAMGLVMIVDRFAAPSLSGNISLVALVGSLAITTMVALAVYATLRAKKIFGRKDD